MYKKLLFMGLVALVLACEPIEIPVQPPAPGALSTALVDMSTDYRWQVYFSLETGQEIKRNLKTEWDLAFGSQANDWQVHLNGAKLMSAAFFEQTSFASKTDTAGFAIRSRIDHSGGHRDSTAFGDWRDKSGIYIVNLGFDPAGRALGFGKMRLISQSATAFRFQYGSLTDTLGQTIDLPKSPAQALVPFSFQSGVRIDLFPPQPNWDLCFTQYTHLFPNETPPLPYLVVGVLLNPAQTSAIEVLDRPFNDIDLAYAQQQLLSTRWDVIGYDWKSFGGSVFVTDASRSYIVKTRSGQFYKLKFLDFYGPTGNKGATTMAFQRL